MDLKGTMSFDSSMSDRTNQLIAQINRDLGTTKILDIEDDRMLKLIESIGEKIT